MQHSPRHQCLVYSGAPSVQLKSLARHIRDKLKSKYRCIYMNSAPMVAGIRSMLSQEGVEVAQVLEHGNLILSSDQSHLVDGQFDPERMLGLLKDKHTETLREGYAGLWASGDMAWEFGPARDFRKLVVYEQMLEQFLQAHPTMCGVCQYHQDMLPAEVSAMAESLHPGIYVNETFARINHSFVPNHA